MKQTSRDSQKKHYQKHRIAILLKRKEQNATKTYSKSDRLKAVFRSMKRRCYAVNYPESNYYRDKGILIYSEWLIDPQKFVEWALRNGYEFGLTIDRKDNSKGYFPDNCRFINMKQQCLNKDSNLRISYLGETKTLKEWSIQIGVNYKIAWARYKKGYSIEDALFVGKFDNKKQKLPNG